MRKAIYSGPGRKGICICGHFWDRHHLGIIMRDGAEQVSGGGVEYFIPQECEAFGVNEDFGYGCGGGRHCFGYRDALDNG